MGGGSEDQRGPCIWARGKKPHSPEKNAGWPGQTTCPQEFLTFRAEHSRPAVLQALGLWVRVLPWRLRQTSLEEREGPGVCQDRALGLEHPASRAALVHPGLDGVGAAATCAETRGSGQQGLWRSPGGLGCSSGVEGPGVSDLGHPVGPPATGPESPVLEVARSACGLPRALAWYIPHWWRGWDPLALVSALGGVKALAERRLRATWRPGRGDAPSWKDAGRGAPARSVWGRLPASFRDHLCHHTGHPPGSCAPESGAQAPGQAWAGGSLPPPSCDWDVGVNAHRPLFTHWKNPPTWEQGHTRATSMWERSALQRAVSHASRGFVPQSSLCSQEAGTLSPMGPGAGAPANVPTVMRRGQCGAGGGATRVHPGHASPWLWGASEIPWAHSLHTAGLRSGERPRSLPREGRACLGWLTPLARAVPGGCRCSGRALTATRVPHGPHGGAALVPDGAQVRIQPLSIPSRVTWGKNTPGLCASVSPCVKHGVWGDNPVFPS